jgi:peptidoglycan/LPS O-acetylase OafA/YrhL
MIRRMWVGITVVWLAVLWILPLPIRTDIGRWDDVAVTNFYGVEYGAGTSFRWSRPDAQVTVVGVGAGTYDLQIMASSVTPTELIVRVANTTQRIQITPGFTRYTIPVLIPFDWHDRVMVHLAVADPSTVDRRIVGVAVDEIRLIPHGIVWPAWLAWLLSIVVVGLTAFWMRWWIRRVDVRWLGALVLVTSVIVLRRGDAVQFLWLWLMVSALGVAVAHQWYRTRRTHALLIAGTTVVTSVYIWLGGLATWQPLWQLLVVLGVVWSMRWRRWWWPVVRPYRYVFVGVLIIGCIALGPLGGVIAAGIGIVWVGSQRWSFVRAAASIGPLIERWLQGGRVVPVDMSGRRFGLDALRAFAIGTVVLGHASATLAYYPIGVAWIPQWFAFVGVECFFVLSGWLIGGLIIRVLPTWQHGDAVQLFLHRRWGRTLPPYWLMLAIVAVAGWSGATWQALTPYWVFGQNIWQAHPPYFFVAWSLAVEEWFYLLTALGLALGVRLMRPAYALFGVLVFLTLVPLVLRTWLALGDLPWEAGLRQFVPLRLDAIAVGMLMVWWWRIRGQVVRRDVTWLGMIGAIVSVWLFWQSHTTLDTAVWPRILLIPLTTISVALIIPALATWRVVVAASWQRGIQTVAAISYSLYLVHIPWRLTIEGLFGGIGQLWWRDILITMIYLIGAVWLAHQWYRLLEAPLMALRWPDQTETPRRVDEG